MEYLYRARNMEGKMVTGLMEVNSITDVYRRLREEGLIPISVRLHKNRTRWGFWEKKINNHQLMMFCQNVATLLRAGVPLVEGLQNISEQAENDFLKKVYNQIAIEIGKGSSFADAIRTQKIFPKLVAALVEVGEETGQLEKSFRELSVFYNRQGEVGAKVKNALMYPVIVICFAVVVIYILSVYSLPKILSMVSHMKASLGITTKILLVFSAFAQDYGLIALVLFAAGGIGIWKACETVWREPFHRIQYKIPVFGLLWKKQMASQFASAMATLFAAGVDLPTSFDIVKGLIPNTQVKKNLDQVKMAVIEGKNISLYLSKDFFDPMVINIISIGEKTGDWEEPLKIASQYLDREVNTVVSRLTEMIMPIAIVFLGIIVTIVLIGVMGPIFEIYRHPGAF